MDINDLRGFSTLLLMIAFIVLCVWAYSPKRKERFDEAANAPFADEQQPTIENQAQHDKSTNH
jgi:cytochrome c oxidase cbb3-type subunit 4